MYSTFKDINDMSAADIQEKLNSGSYMSSNTRKTLTDRLNMLSENGSYTKKKEAGAQKPQSKSINDAMFPTFITVESKSMNSLDFAKFAKNESSHSQELLNKDININYDEISKIYDDFAFLRLKLYHNELYNKTRILCAIKLVKHYGCLLYTSPSPRD